jgi:hypothetical protein
MSEHEKTEEHLDDAELERQDAELLPDREVMSVLDHPTGPPTIFPGEELPPP